MKTQLAALNYALANASWTMGGLPSLDSVDTRSMDLDTAEMVLGDGLRSPRTSHRAALEALRLATPAILAKLDMVVL